MYYDDVTVTCEGKPVPIEPCKLLQSTLREHFRHQTLRFKTITGENFYLTTKTSLTIAQVKIELMFSRGIARNSELKLIYCGKILSDDQLVQDLKYLQDDSFIVVMIKKPR
jgi:hypothetical protein